MKIQSCFCVCVHFKHGCGSNRLKILQAFKRQSGLPADKASSGKKSKREVWEVPLTQRFKPRPQPSPFRALFVAFKIGATGSLRNLNIQVGGFPHNLILSFLLLKPESPPLGPKWLHISYFLQWFLYDSLCSFILLFPKPCARRASAPPTARKSSGVRTCAISFVSHSALCCVRPKPGNLPI